MGEGTSGLSRDEAAGILRRLHEAQQHFYAGGDRGALAAVLTDDVVWHVPGTSPIAGTYDGLEATLAYMTARRTLAATTFRMHPRELLVGEEHVASITDGTVERDGGLERWSTIGLYRIRDGRICEVHLLPFDQQHFDRVWSSLGG